MLFFRRGVPFPRTRQTALDVAVMNGDAPSHRPCTNENTLVIPMRMINTLPNALVNINTGGFPMETEIDHD